MMMMCVCVGVWVCEETAGPADGASQCSGRAAGEPGSEGEARARPILYTKATKGSRDETRSNPTGAQLPRAEGSCEGKKSGPEAPTHSGRRKDVCSYTRQTDVHEGGCTIAHT
jgi:hypothetical protein